MITNKVENIKRNKRKDKTKYGLATDISLKKAKLSQKGTKKSKWLIKCSTWNNTKSQKVESRIQSSLQEHPIKNGNVPRSNVPRETIKKLSNLINKK